MAPAVDENGLVVTVNDPGSNGEPPDYLLDPKCKGQLGIFRAWFTLMFLLIFMCVHNHNPLLSALQYTTAHWYLPSLMVPRLSPLQYTGTCLRVDARNPLS